MNRIVITQLQTLIILMYVITQGGTNMKRKVLVENELNEVRQYLAGLGYDVRTMYFNETADHITTDEYDAIVVRDKNSLDEASMRTNSPVIEAAGLSTEQVHERIRNAGRH
jgi:hypothetical protein